MSHLQQKFPKSKKATALIYKKLISNKSLTSLESSQKKWQEDCSVPINDNINWIDAYLLAKKMRHEPGPYLGFFVWGGKLHKPTQGSPVYRQGF